MNKLRYFVCLSLLYLAPWDTFANDEQDDPAQRATHAPLSSGWVDLGRATEEDDDTILVAPPTPSDTHSLDLSTSSSPQAQTAPDPSAVTVPLLTAEQEEERRTPRTTTQANDPSFFQDLLNKPYMFLLTRTFSNIWAWLKGIEWVTTVDDGDSDDE